MLTAPPALYFFWTRSARLIGLAERSFDVVKDKTLWFSNLATELVENGAKIYKDIHYFFASYCISIWDTLHKTFTTIVVTVLWMSCSPPDKDWICWILAQWRKQAGEWCILWLLLKGLWRTVEEPSIPYFNPTTMVFDPTQLTSEEVLKS